jgi:elongation factor G
MDRVGASFDRTLSMIRERLGANPVALQMPIGAESGFRGVVDLLTQEAVLWQDELGAAPLRGAIPAELAERVDGARALMVEQIVETDDGLMGRFLEGESVGPEELKSALRRAVIAGKLTPVLCGSSLRNKGVRLVLDAVIDYLPSPLDVPPVRGLKPDTEVELTRETRDDVPLSALVFKIVTDPYVGRLAYFRVYSGKITKGSTVYNATKGKRERVGRLIRMYADRREDIDEVLAGDIAAVLGMKETFTGDTLCDAANAIILENITFPEPVIFASIEPKTSVDQDKLGEALLRLSEEDPTFRVGADDSTGQTMIWGMGELHLDVLVERMRREFKVQARIGRPRVAYKESILRAVPKLKYTHKKQTGGHGQFAQVEISLEPGEPGSGVEFEQKIRGGTIPQEFIPAVEKGVREAAESGVLAGYPVTDIKVSLLDGAFHEVDSSDMAFKVAGSMAFKQAVQQAGPVLLEPMMKVEVVVQQEAVGDVTGDLAARRANILGIESRPGNTQVVNAGAPLAEMFGYATELRSMTQGRGVFTMEFDHYAPVGAKVSEALLAGVS